MALEFRLTLGHAASILGKESIVADNKVQQVILSDINYQIAELYSHELKDLDKASAYYNESIEHDSGKKKVSYHVI